MAHKQERAQLIFSELLERLCICCSASATQPYLFYHSARHGNALIAFLEYSTCAHCPAFCTPRGRDESGRPSIYICVFMLTWACRREKRRLLTFIHTEVGRLIEDAKSRGSQASNTSVIMHQTPEKCAFGRSIPHHGISSQR